MKKTQRLKKSLIILPLTRVVASQVSQARPAGSGKLQVAWPKKTLVCVMEALKAKTKVPILRSPVLLLLWSRKIRRLQFIRATLSVIIIIKKVTMPTNVSVKTSKK